MFVPKDLGGKSLLNQQTGGRLDIKMPSYQYRDPHGKDKTVSRPSIFNMEIPIPRKTVFTLRRDPVSVDGGTIPISIQERKQCESAILRHDIGHQRPKIDRSRRKQDCFLRKGSYAYPSSVMIIL